MGLEQKVRESTGLRWRSLLPAYGVVDYDRRIESASDLIRETSGSIQELYALHDQRTTPRIFGLVVYNVLLATVFLGAAINLSPILLPTYQPTRSRVESNQHYNTSRQPRHQQSPTTVVSSLSEPHGSSH